MKKKISFIINPISGLGKSNTLPALLEKHLDHSIFDYEIIRTEYSKHAKIISKELVAKGVDIICAVGGDGSVHEVGTALIGTKTALAILPTGSGNGLARHLHIPLNLVDAIKAINKHQFISIDTGLVNDKQFLGVGGYGFDALIAKKFDLSHTRGFMSYVKLVLKEFYCFKPLKVKVELPGDTFESSVILCSVANSSQFGNGFTISPNSNLSDGKFELCILKPFPWWKTLSLAYRFFTRSIHKDSYSQIISFDKARLTLERQIAHYDGEPFRVRKEINIEVNPKSLQVLIPA